MEQSKEKEVTDSGENGTRRGQARMKTIFELKEEQSEFLAERRLKDLAKKLSGFPASPSSSRGKIEGEGSDRFG